MHTRPSAVAGMFYEGEKNVLQVQVNNLLEQSVMPIATDAAALVVPHAGYIYSGAVAAQAYKTIGSRADTINRVVLIGPAHRVYINGMAIPAAKAFRTPLGDIPLDRDSLDHIRSLPDVVVSDEAHRQEHSLEVQLPFLQTILRDFRLVPVVVGDCQADSVANVLDSLWGSAETLVVISSDLSHFHTYQQARQIDAQTCQRIAQKSSDLTGNEACGAHAINGLMRSKHCQNLTVDLINACNSGDTAGDKTQVVGYGAFILH
ncbi:MAG: AmmeMemoRadiSam system protein B [Gammaproteobacteria bacterium]|nr:AmmeMemoRadiSam system protein B [Gammaproteobacteria bacterium]